MFERFTHEARETVTVAQEVARETSSRSIDTRHLLLALATTDGAARTALRESGTDLEALAVQGRTDLRSGSIDAGALAGIGIDLDAVRRQADAVFGPDALQRAGLRPRGRVPFAPDAKKALELSLREALRLRHTSIDSRHLLLGLLRSASPGRALLQKAGVDTDALRKALEEQSEAA
jgi:ATP-dependent Clp protease ATP-binding subunit ClpA